MSDAAVATPEQAADIEAEAAFSTGFDAAPAQAAPETKPAENATAQTEEVKAEVKPDVKPEPKPIVFNSEDEFNAAVAKAATPLVEQARAETRKNFSQIGDVHRTLKDIQTKLATGGTPAARKKLTAEALKRVNEELPGLGDALAQDLSDYLDSPAVAAEAAVAQASAESKGQAFNADDFFATKLAPALKEMETRHGEQVAQLLKDNEEAQMDIVYDKHPDFDQVVKSSEFTAWLGSLPTDEQTRIRDSNRGRVAAKSVTDFKAWQDKAAKDKAGKNTRLEGALTPSGDRRPSTHVPIDDEAAFSTGFNSVK